MGGAAVAAATALTQVSSATAETGLPRRTVAARRRFFGARNVDGAGRVRRDRVILSWFGCTSFAMAIDGRVVLLDAWIPRGLYSGRVPTGVAEVAALRPSHIYIGHGHFDHAADAGPIAAASGAVVVGTPTHCDQAARQAPRHIRTMPLDAPRVGDEDEVRLSRRVRVTALRHVHSAVQPPTGDDLPLLLAPDVTPVLKNPPEIEDTVDTLSHLRDEEGGCLLYRFDIGAFSLTWHDSTGPLREEAPMLAEQLSARPLTSVHLGAIQGFGQLTNGLRDPIDYVRAINPRIFVPTHHDNWFPPVSSPASSYEGRLREALARIPERRRPELRFIRDTEDYVNPRRLTFAI